MPDSYVCYEPPSEAPEVSPLPAYGRSYVTFASFNNPAKITAEVVDVWAAILRQVPRARLLLKYLGMDDEVPGEVGEPVLCAEVAADRLVFRGWSSFADYLAEFREVDVVLDPFPFSGGVTTCNALWMGVPVITCPGKTFASRHGLSYLSSMGMTETIAGDLHGICSLGYRAGDGSSIGCGAPRGLRPQMAGSPLCDGPRHAASLLGMLRHVWRDYCAHGIERTG